MEYGRSEPLWGELTAARNRQNPKSASSYRTSTQAREGHYQQATDRLRQALALADETGNRTAEAEALNYLGEVLLATARPGEAHIHYAAALATARQIGDKFERARSYHGLARAYQATGDSDQARHHWQALVLYTGLGTPEADQIRAQFTAEEAEFMF
jgi:tetratricopeptide (TPR) repeat protein